MRKRTPFVLWMIVAGVGLLTFLILATKRSRARAEWIQCANILSSLECAVRCYALDYNGTYALNLQCMSNEISTTKILICPGDKARVHAANFGVLSPSNVSYVFLVAGVQNTNAAKNALFRCPIHGHTVYSDGRIVRGDGTIQYGKGLF